MPMARFWLFTLLSFPVDFQYPARVARFVLNPFGYFRSLGPKKYHSGSLLGKKDFSTNINKQSFQMTWSFYAQINFTTYVIRRTKKKKKKHEHCIVGLIDHLPIPRARICRDRLRGWYRARFLGPGFSSWGNSWQVLHQWDGIWNLEAIQLGPCRSIDRY